MLTKQLILANMPEPLTNTEYYDFISVSADDIDMRKDLEIFFRTVIYHASGINKLFYLSCIDSNATIDEWLSMLHTTLYPLVLRIIK